MTSTKLTIVAAWIIGAWSGCGVDDRELQGTASVSYELQSNGVQILSAEYDLETQAGVDVFEGSIGVASGNSVVRGTLRSLAPGDYQLSFSATALYDGEQILCASEPALFSLSPGQHMVLGDMVLKCTVRVAGSIEVQVNAQLQPIAATIAETLVVAPRTAGVAGDGSSCIWDPVELGVRLLPDVTYAWTSEPDGSFLFIDEGKTSGSYQCESAGAKTVTLTATRANQTVTFNVDVTCLNNASSCCGTIPVCGDGLAMCEEECDDGNLDAGDGCSPTCTLEPPPDPCQLCINAIPGGVGAYNASICEPDPTCVAVRSCLLEPINPLVGSCYVPESSECYCGIGADLDACEEPDFFETNPFGPCTLEMRAGLPPNYPDLGPLDYLNLYRYPTIRALYVVGEIADHCASECGVD